MARISDVIGNRGQAICELLLTELDDRGYPLFKPQFLGDKWRTVDLLVELEGRHAAVPFFFVQVKATTQGYTVQERRLKVSVSSEDIQRMKRYPAPVYIIGIDETQKKGYLVSTYRAPRNGWSSLSTAFPLNANNRRLLWHEVKQFWMSVSIRSKKSHFAAR